MLLNLKISMLRQYSQYSKLLTRVRVLKISSEKFAYTRLVGDSRTRH